MIGVGKLAAVKAYEVVSLTFYQQEENKAERDPMVLTDHNRLELIISSYYGYFERVR